jgi:GT2 family glycosyltransferase
MERIYNYYSKMKHSLIIPAYFYNQDIIDMTLDCVRSIKENVEIILVADNKPYASNVNSGLRASTGDIIIIGNNDLTFPQKWLTELLRPLHKGFDIATCWSSNQNVTLENKIESEAKFDCLWAMKRTVYETLGDLDETFKGYFSDTDYRRRALNNGFTVGKNCNLVIEHKSKATYKITDPEDQEYLRSKLLYEAKWGFVE